MELNGEDQFKCRSTVANSDDQDFYFQGCYSTVKKTLVKNADVAFGLGISLLAMSSFNMALSLIMSTMIHSKKTDSKGLLESTISKVFSLASNFCFDFLSKFQRKKSITSYLCCFKDFHLRTGSLQ